MQITLRHWTDETTPTLVSSFWCVDFYMINLYSCLFISHSFPGVIMPTMLSSSGRLVSCPITAYCYITYVRSFFFHTNSSLQAVVEHFWHKKEVLVIFVAETGGVLFDRGGEWVCLLKKVLRSFGERRQIFRLVVKAFKSFRMKEAEFVCCYCSRVFDRKFRCKLGLGLTLQYYYIYVGNLHALGYL